MVCLVSFVANLIQMDDKSRAEGNYKAMTWRTFSYLITVLLAAVVVATTASSDVFDRHDSTVTAASIHLDAPPVQERGSRVVLLIVGMAAVGFTFRQAWLNFRRGS